MLAGAVYDTWDDVAGLFRLSRHRILLDRQTRWGSMVVDFDWTNNLFAGDSWRVRGCGFLDLVSKRGHYRGASQDE